MLASPPTATSRHQRDAGGYMGDVGASPMAATSRHERVAWVVLDDLGGLSSSCFSIVASKLLVWQLLVLVATPLVGAGRH